MTPDEKRRFAQEQVRRGGSKATAQQVEEELDFILRGEWIEFEDGKTPLPFPDGRYEVLTRFPGARLQDPRTHVREMRCGQWTPRVLVEQIVKVRWFGDL